MAIGRWISLELDWMLLGLVLDYILFSLGRKVVKLSQESIICYVKL